MAGEDNAFYERHLVFDNVVDPAFAQPRERFEAFARSIRDILARRWVMTRRAYNTENPKRIYYLSMEFLIGRSLLNNISNLGLDAIAKEVAEENQHRLARCYSNKSPMRASAMAALAALAACFLNSMATMSLPAMGYGLRYEYGIFKQFIVDGWQQEQPDNWLRNPDPWEVARPHELVEIKMNCSYEVQGGKLRAIPDRPSSLFGIPYDRPIVGYGCKTVNTLRLWAAGAPDYFDFKEFSSGDFVGALAETLAAESVTRVLYPDDSTSQGQALRFVQEYFLAACSLADLITAFPAITIPISETLPDKVAIQLNDTHPTMTVPELMRILLDEDHLELGRGLGSHHPHACLHQSHVVARSTGADGRLPGSN